MATLGKPAIATPRELSLRAVQQAVEAIRERLSALDATVAQVASAGVSSSAAAATLTGVSGSLRSLSARVAVLEDALGVMDILTLAAAEPIGQFAAVVPSGATGCVEADPNDTTRRFGVLGLALTAAVTGDMIRVQRRGPLTIPDAVFEVGRGVYAFNGGLTQMPTYAKAAILVGVAISTTSLWVAPTAPVLREPDIYDDPHEEPMPVAWSLLRDKLALLDDLALQPDGFIVKTGSTVATRALLAGSGSGLVVTNGDGVGGDPQFELE